MIFESKEMNSFWLSILFPNFKWRDFILEVNINQLQFLKGRCKTHRVPFIIVLCHMVFALMFFSWYFSISIFSPRFSAKLAFVICKVNIVSYSTSAFPKIFLNLNAYLIFCSPGVFIALIFIFLNIVLQCYFLLDNWVLGHPLEVYSRG